MEPSQVRSIVRERYARAAGGGSCGCGANPASLGYEKAELESVPAEVWSASLGCGSPVSRADLKPGERVLDLGSGAGFDLSLAARAVGPGGHAFGVDMTPEMLEKARGNLAGQGLSNVTVLEGQIEAIPLPEASVDVVLSNCVINLAPDKAAVFREAYRVLAPGGRIVVSDMLAAAKLPASISEDPKAWSECIAGAISEGDYVAALQAAGFEAIRVARAGKPEGDCCGPAEEGAPSVFSATVTASKPPEASRTHESSRIRA